MVDGNALTFIRGGGAQEGIPEECPRSGVQLGHKGVAAPYGERTNRWGIGTPAGITVPGDKDISTAVDGDALSLVGAG